MIRVCRSPSLRHSSSTPVLRPRLIARPRLDTTVAAGHRLTLVSARGGFGKTTVLGDWLTHLSQRQPRIRVAWLSLDDADNDLTRLMTHVVASLNGVGLGVDPLVLDYLPS